MSPRDWIGLTVRRYAHRDGVRVLIERRVIG